MKALKCFLLSTCLSCVLYGADLFKTFSIVIDKPEAEYTVDVGGTIDPENLEITIENLGDTPVVNPRMTVNGLYDWYDAKSIAAEATEGCRTDEEKALALWSWIHYRRYQRSPDDRSSLNPVRGLNGFGYGICGHSAAWLKCLWAASGVKGRVQELWGHTVTEAYYAGAWHELDGNEKAFYLERDNRTIASLATIEHDRWLVQRTIHPDDPWFRGPDTPAENDSMVRHLTSYKDNYEEHSYDGEIAKDYTMAMTLKPGEKFVRWWGPELGKFEGRGKRAEVPERYANGQLIWEPDLHRVDPRPYLNVPHYGNIATRAEDGRSPVIHVAGLQDSLYTRPSVFTIPIVSPYPIVGGRFSCTLVKEGASGTGMALLSFGQPEWDNGNLYTYRWGKSPATVAFDLDSRFMSQAATYSYDIGVTLRGDSTAKPPAQAGIDAFRLVTDLQVNPQSLPALVLGKNTVRFRHQSSGAARIRITHRWREIEGPTLPGHVVTAVAPADGAEVPSLDPTLKWSPGAPAGDIADYQVMVSLRPDCRWPLSPTLYRNVGSKSAEWKLPTGFLNSGTTYYWRVRARNTRGDIGKWGPVFRFNTTGAAR